MGRPRSPFGYSVSRYNRLSHGVELHALLPSLGIDRCYHAERCPMTENIVFAFMCLPGGVCPYEKWLHERYVESATTYLDFCRAWVTDSEFEALIEELSICELRLRRLHTLVNEEGLLREKRHPVSGYLIGVEMGLGIGRYSDAVHNRFNVAYAKLLNRPELAGEDVARKLGL